SPATDVYALGVMLAELLDDGGGLAARDARFGEIVRRARDEDPSRRYEHAGAMADALDATLCDRPAANTSRRGNAWSRVEGMAMAAVVVLIVGLQFASALQREASPLAAEVPPSVADSSPSPGSSASVDS